jgi:hypothetical protein
VGGAASDGDGFEMLCVFKNSGKQRKNSERFRCYFARRVIGSPRISAKNEGSLADNLSPKQQKQRTGPCHMTPLVNLRRRASVPHSPIGASANANLFDGLLFR